MKDVMLGRFAAQVKDFHLPRYEALPAVGLYLEQVTKYINGVLSPLGCPELTSSMVSNYVKKGVIAPPVKKLYEAEQIAYLIFIGVGKSVLSIESIAQLFAMQKKTYPPQVAYDYFCSEMENMLHYVAGLRDDMARIGVTNSAAKTLLRSAIISASHSLFLSDCFRALQSEEEA